MITLTKKITFLIIILMIFPIINVKANETEDALNNISKSLSDLKNKVNKLSALNEKYPIGSIYITNDNKNPSTTLGGTWEAYGQGRTLIGVGSNGTNNYQTVSSIGGNSKVSLQSSNLPSHTHTLTPLGTVTSTFEGISTATSSNGDHTHNVFKESGDEATSYAALENENFAGRVMIRTNTAGPTFSSSDGNHTHILTPQGTITSTFNGTTSNTSSAGSSQSFSVQNPYITVYFWKRTK